MKPLTLYVSDEIYSSYKKVALSNKTKAAALIRNAMEYYLKEVLAKKHSLENWKPLDLGNLKQDWLDGSIQEEMFDDRY